MALKPAGELIGGLTLTDRTTHAFDADSVEIARQVGASLAVAIQNAQLFEQIRRDREQLQALSRRLLQVQESERRALARELHDDAGQALTAVKIGLGLVVRDSEDAGRLAERIAELKETVDAAIVSVRRIALNLRPPALDRVGLAPAVEHYVARFREQTGLDVQVLIVGFETQRLSSEVETNLYRMLQESLANIARHSAASRVDVVLEAQPQNVVLVVEDDGEGFDLDQALQKGHLGLVSLRERAEMMGGTLHIESALGSGTAVFVQVPIGN